MARSVTVRSTTESQNLIHTEARITPQGGRFRPRQLCTALDGFGAVSLLRRVRERILQHFRLDQACVSKPIGESCAIQKPAEGEPILGASRPIARRFVQPHSVLIKLKGLVQPPGLTQERCFVNTRNALEFALFGLSCKSFGELIRLKSLRLLGCSRLAIAHAKQDRNNLPRLRTTCCCLLRGDFEERLVMRGSVPRLTPARCV